MDGTQVLVERRIVMERDGVEARQESRPADRPSLRQRCEESPPGIQFLSSLTRQPLEQHEHPLR